MPQEKGRIAWAVEQGTNAIRHILEVEPGLACQCVCPDCDAKLEAVNSRNPHWKRIPHFRHHGRREAPACAIAAVARAIQHVFETLPAIDLPERIVVNEYLGASHISYRGVAAAPATRINIQTAEWTDPYEAIATLPDGRKLLVRLVATATRGNVQPFSHQAAIEIDVSDPELASLGPDVLREYLAKHAIWAWRAHWEDASLNASALFNAEAAARNCFDLVGVDNESEIHFAMKQAIESLGQITVPEIVVEVSKRSNFGDWVTHKKTRAPKLVQLSNIRLEHKVGAIRPDLVASSGGHDLLIEVTVTHGISHEKREAIKSIGAPALEIDLSSLPGTLSRESLNSLVLESASIKRWLFHPWIDRIRAELEQEVDAEVARLNAAARQRAAARSQSSRNTRRAAPGERALTSGETLDSMLAYLRPEGRWGRWVFDIGQQGTVLAYVGDDEVLFDVSEATQEFMDVITGAGAEVKGKFYQLAMEPFREIISKLTMIASLRTGE